MNNSTLTKKQIMLSRISIGIISLTAGVFLLLIGAGAVSRIEFFRAAIAVPVMALGLMLLTVGFIQDNTLFIWFSVVFIISGIIIWFAVCACSGITFANAYPVFIFAPALASFLISIYDGGWKTHLKIIIPLSVIAGILALNSMLGVGWGIVIPVFVLLFGLCWFLFALMPHIRLSGQDNDLEDAD